MVDGNPRALVAVGVPMTPEYRKVEALLAMGRPEEAAALVQSLPQREVPDPEFLRLRGRALRATGRVFDAEASFREALAVRANDAGLMADLASTLYGQKRAREALAFAREAVRLRPDAAAWQMLLGVIAEALELDEQARTALTAARGLAPADPETHTVFGFHALRTWDFEAAEEAFREAIAVDPRRAEPLRGLAHVALRRGDWVEARRRWKESLAVDPRQRDLTLNPVLNFGFRFYVPLRRLARIHRVWSYAFVGTGLGLLVAASDRAAAILVAVLLFAVASVGPAARHALDGGPGE